MEENKNERKDSWKSDDDMILTEIVLDHIRNGSTQLKAFDEASERLGRTAAACGFRWNSEVRKRHEEAIQEAKKQRGKPRLVQPVKVPARTTGMLKDHLQKISKYIDMLERKVEQQRNEILGLKEQLNQERPDIKVNEDLQNLLQIIDRARKMGYLDKAN